MSVATSNKTRITDIVNAARQIAEESNRPMSPDQIRGKFQLEFPFTVKRVVEGTVDACGDGAVGSIITFKGLCRSGWYLFGERPCRICGCQHAMDPDSERFVLV